MAKRFDPIRHWSIAVFVVLAVAVGAALLPVIARFGGWKLTNQTRGDLKLTGITLAVLFLIELMLWIEVMGYLHSWWHRRNKEKKNPYDQR